MSHVHICRIKGHLPHVKVWNVLNSLKLKGVQESPSPISLKGEEQFPFGNQSLALWERQSKLIPLPIWRENKTRFLSSLAQSGYCLIS